jgi:hypothetical protein
MTRLVFAFATVLLVFPVAAQAQQSWREVSIQTGLSALDTAPIVTPNRAEMMRLPVMPDTPTKFLPNFVTVGPAQTGTPCFACVKGAQTMSNVGLTIPYNYIATNEEAQYTISFSNISNTANCTLSWAITAGKTVVDKFAAVVKTPSPNSSYIYGVNRARPKFSGAAVLSGKVLCTGAGYETVTAPLIFQ